MGKVVDITDKLDFEESPKLKIKDTEIRVKDDAPTLLKVMGKLGEKVSPKDIAEMYELLFTEEDRQKVDKMKLNFKNFQTLVKAAIAVVTGNDIEKMDEMNEQE